MYIPWFQTLDVCPLHLIEVILVFLWTIRAYSSHRYTICVIKLKKFLNDFFKYISLIPLPSPGVSLGTELRILIGTGWHNFEFSGVPGHFSLPSPTALFYTFVH